MKNKSERPPAFQFYAGDFLSRTAGWSPQERGALITLMASQWINGPLPKDLERLARICGCSINEFESVWKVISELFKTKNETVFIERIEGYRDELRKRRKQASEAGKKSAEVRRLSAVGGVNNG